jgi:hypothetical protein
MQKCKNCGSTAQFKLLLTSDIDDMLIKEYACGCGYKEKVYYKLDRIEGRFLGTLIYTEKDKARHEGVKK